MKWRKTGEIDDIYCNGLRSVLKHRIAMLAEPNEVLVRLKSKTSEACVTARSITFKRA